MESIQNTKQDFRSTGQLIEVPAIINLPDSTTGTVEFLVPLKNLTSSKISLSYSFSCGCTSSDQKPFVDPNQEIEIPFKIQKVLKKNHSVSFTIKARTITLSQESLVTVNFKYK